MQRYTLHCCAGSHRHSDADCPPAVIPAQAARLPLFRRRPPACRYSGAGHPPAVIPAQATRPPSFRRRPPARRHSGAGRPPAVIPAQATRPPSFRRRPPARRHSGAGHPPAVIPAQAARPPSFRRRPSRGTWMCRQRTKGWKSSLITCRGSLPRHVVSRGRPCISLDSGIRRNDDR